MFQDFSLWKSLRLHFEFFQMTNFWKHIGQDLGQSAKKKVFADLSLDTGHSGCEYQSPNRVRKSTGGRGNRRLVTYGIFI